MLSKKILFCQITPNLGFKAKIMRSILRLREAILWHFTRKWFEGREIFTPRTTHSFKYDSPHKTVNQTQCTDSFLNFGKHTKKYINIKHIKHFLFFIIKLKNMVLKKVKILYIFDGFWKDFQKTSFVNLSQQFETI